MLVGVVDGKVTRLPTKCHNETVMQRRAALPRIGPLGPEIELSATLTSFR